MSAGAPVGILAHQGGWDELLFVLGPIAVIVALLWLAKWRSDRFGPPPEPGTPNEPPR